MPGYHYSFVDLQTLEEVGRHVAAVRAGLPGAESLTAARANGIADRTWQLDAGALIDVICGDCAYEHYHAHLWGTLFLPGALDREHPGRCGMRWQVHEHPGDAAVAFELISRRLLFDLELGGPRGEHDRIALVVGDALYSPLVADLVGDGYSVDVLFWSEVAADLRSAATRFVCLDDQLQKLTERSCSSRQMTPEADADDADLDFRDTAAAEAVYGRPMLSRPPQDNRQD